MISLAIFECKLSPQLPPRLYLPSYSRHWWQEGSRLEGVEAEVHLPVELEGERTPVELVAVRLVGSNIVDNRRRNSSTHHMLRRDPDYRHHNIERIVRCNRSGWRLRVDLVVVGPCQNLPLSAGRRIRRIHHRRRRNLVGLDSLHRHNLVAEEGFP